MIYYPEHTMDESPEISTGILRYKTPDISVVNDLEIQNNRALDGDIVYYDTEKVLQIHTRHRRCIVGVLEITKLKIYGYTSKGIPIYNMVPLSWRFPNFQVPSSIVKKHKPLYNVYVLITFKEWTSAQKYPVGSCVKVLGCVTDHLVSDIALLYKNDIYIKSHNIMEYTPNNKDHHRIVHDEAPVIAIDPQGSLDYDDAFHVTGDKVYVHIADVDYYFPKEGAYEKELINRYTTVYSSVIHNMLPPLFSNKIISLNTEGKKKTFTVEMHYINGELIPYNVYLSEIQVRDNITYEKAQKKKHQALFSDIFRLCGESDVHKVIEKLMVKANSYIAETLCKAGIYFLRSCAFDPVPHDTDVACLSYLHKRNKQGAQYTIEDKAHDLLGLKHYTHFTSPIRRYADLIVQRLLKSILHNEQRPYSNIELEQTASHINEYNIRIKRYYKDAAVLKLYTIVGETIVNTKGYIVQYKPESNIVTVYIPQYNIEYSYALYSRKLKHLYTVSTNNNMIVISESCSIPMYTELDINLSTNSQEIHLNKKVIMRICAITEEITCVK